jgi:outer membrane protein OmpA-like peptidoglycan-associated protein
VKKAIVVFLMLGLAASGLFAETFLFKFTKGEKYRIVGTVDAQVFVNGKFSNNLKYLDKIAVEVTDAINGGGSISALYQVSGRAEADEGSYTMEEEVPSAFRMDAQGRIVIEPRYLYPLTRNIPLFPATEMSDGFSWSAAGTEVHDLREFGMKKPFVFPVNVQYSYLGTQDKDGKKIAQFQIQYAYGVKVAGIIPPKDQPKLVGISGENSMVYNWDIEKGNAVSYAEEFDVIYVFADKQTMEFKGTAQSEVIVAQPLNKDKAADDINKEIEKNKLEGVHAEKTDQGVKITLENIQFQPDSDEITLLEEKKIETIAEILKKYPDRDIKLEGHTAAVGTPESCMELSIRRAKSVGDALLKLDAKKAEQMTIQGKGLTEPLAPNTTEAGRKKNRRVEIIILEN